MNPLNLIDENGDLIPFPVFRILEELGLGPEFRIVDDNISGWIERRETDKYHIVINAKHSLPRQRFTAAHELGHFIYHRALLGSGTGDTRAYRADKSPLPNAAIRPRHERQANTFAANLLMSAKSIDKLRNEDIQDVERMAERLGVSAEAMRIRLGDLF